MQLSDSEAPAAIARLLAGDLAEAPYRVPETPGDGEPGEGAPVYEIRLHSRELGREILLLVWPSLNRVDARAGASTWTLKSIDEVELYPGVEVLFRRHDPAAILFVSVEGRVALVA